MSDPDEIACPCESVDPAGSPGRVNDAETLLYVVRKDAWINWEGDIPRLSAAAIRREDVEAEQEGKSVSCMREKYMAIDNMVARAKCLNLTDAWGDDPVVAKALAKTLRDIRSATSWQEICVCADPTDASDRCGACPEHASVKRSIVDPKTRGKGTPQPMERQKRRSAVAEAFNTVFHLKSGKPLSKS